MYSECQAYTNENITTFMGKYTNEDSETKFPVFRKDGELADTQFTCEYSATLGVCNS